MSENPKLIDKWSRDLPEPVRTVVATLVSRVETAGTAAYLVGGPVRDLLLGHASLDTDIVVEGDAIALAHSFDGNPMVTRVVAHPAFATATLRLAGGHVDVITARSEKYSRPGVLPRVIAGTIVDDLARRDFTINAMAVRLTGPNRGELLDPHDGGDDLEAELVRALHERSFQDDATRILRAARYATRLGFDLEAETEGWLRRDVGYLATISAARMHQEMTRVLTEPEPEVILARLEGLGALEAIDPSLTFNDDAAARFRTARELVPHVTQATLWTLLAWGIPPQHHHQLFSRVRLTIAQQEAVEAIASARHAAHHVRGSARTSEVVHVLAPVPESTLVALAAVSEPDMRSTIMEFLTTLRHVRPILRGDDAIALGVERGPRVAEVLDLIRVAKLNGTVSTRQDEEAFVQDYVAHTT